MTADQSARRFFYLLLAGAALLTAWVVRPLAMPLFLATVLAVVLWPIFEKLTVKLGDRPSVASALVVLAVVLLLLAPLVAFSTFVVKEGSDGLKFISTQAHSERVSELVKKLPAPLEKLAAEILAHIPEEQGSAEAPKSGDTSKAGDAPRAGGAPRAGDEPTKPLTVDQVSAGSEKAVAAIGAAAKASGSFLLQATMMVIALYFMLLRGADLVKWLDGILPLPEGQTRELLSEFKSVSYATVVSTVITAGVQALAALIGYFIARVPHPFFFASLTFFVAFIPAIGAASVCLVAALILYATGHPYMALFLVIWGLAIVGLVDNLVKPMLIRSGSQMDGAIVFFALIGGLTAFGTGGLLIGPLVVALFLALLRIYQRDYRKPIHKRSQGSDS